MYRRHWVELGLGLPAVVLKSTGLGWTGWRVERSTLWCREADVGVGVKIRAIVIDCWVERAEIRQDQFVS